MFDYFYPINYHKLFISAIPMIFFWSTVSILQISGIEQNLSEKQLNKNQVTKKQAFFCVFELVFSQFIINYIIHPFFNIDYQIFAYNDNTYEYTDVCLFFIKIFAGIIIIDTCEYITHYYCHTISYLYKNYHKVHHEMICPWSFGALYNSRTEASLTGIPILLSFIGLGFSFETYIIANTLAFIKTIWDHTWKGTKTLNEHHWVHHEINKNYNYQQPFFDFYDRLFDTKYLH